MMKINQSEPLYGEAEIEATAAYLKKGGWITEFEETKKFESMLAEYTGAKYCVVVPNATCALFLALKSVGIGPGDEVIVPDMTMIATPNSVVMAGAKPIFADVDPDTLCLNIDTVREVITEKTKAILYVSLNGRSSDVVALKNFCFEKDIFLIEDAAQSLGSFFQGRHLGTYGSVGVLSFSPHKIITTGQGGALLTDDNDLYDRLIKLKDFGRSKGGVDDHPYMGWNFKFTDLQSVFGIEQMRTLPERVERKKSIYRKYQSLLSDISGIKFIPTNFTDTAPWFVDIYMDEPYKLAEYLKIHGVSTRSVYPAIHTQPIYATEEGGFPISSIIGKTGLWLPSSLTLTDGEIEYIAKNVHDYFANSGS